MSTKTDIKVHDFSISLEDGLMEFILSRRSNLCSKNSIIFYENCCGQLVKYLETEDVHCLNDIQATHIRRFLVHLSDIGRAPRTVVDVARAIKVMLRFWNGEGYLDKPIEFQVPKIQHKRMPTLNSEQLKTVLDSCDCLRDKVLVMFMVDTGLRKSEIISTTWNDLDLSSGVLKIPRGKGGKSRIVVIGSTTLRQLLKYRRTLADHSEGSPVFQTQQGTKFSQRGFANIFVRLSRKSGIHLNPHQFRRAFAILSLRAGMNSIVIQQLAGWSNENMLKLYAQMEDVDLIESHNRFSPIDHLK